MRPIISLPPIIFGTSVLGNLFVELDEATKLDIVKQYRDCAATPLVFDTAGKYGAGLALESLGNSLRQLNVRPEDVIISNKLAWVRIALTTPEPTFEPGVWKGIKHDAVQRISYNGIIECFEQGNDLLGTYIPQLVSVHDPDEYLERANNEAEEKELYNDILEAYRALVFLKNEGRILAIGVGAKNWRSIEKISKDIDLDWVMIANSMTIQRHPADLLEFMETLKTRHVQIINAAVFHSGFLTGGDYYDYRFMEPEQEENNDLFKWRRDFFAVCKTHAIKPAGACMQFGLSAPGVVSVALSTTNPILMKENLEMATKKLPDQFWRDMKSGGLIKEYYTYLPG